MALQDSTGVDETDRRWRWPFASLLARERVGLVVTGVRRCVFVQRRRLDGTSAGSTRPSLVAKQRSHRLEHCKRGYAGPTQRRQCSRISTMLRVSSSQYRCSNPAHISFFSGSFLSAPYIISWYARIAPVPSWTSCNTPLISTG